MLKPNVGSSYSLTWLFYSRLALVAASVAIPSFLALLLLPRIPQDQKYHDYSDKRKIFGIPYFWNVASNLPFSIFGIWGLVSTLRRFGGKFPHHNHPHRHGTKTTKKEQLMWLMFYVTCILVGPMSAYYHYAPNNTTLTLDRVSLVCAVLQFTSLIIAKRVSVNMGFTTLLPFTFFGIYSVAHWYYSELKNQGDLRLFGIAQFAPVIGILGACLFFPISKKATQVLPSTLFQTSNRHGNIYIALVMLFFGLAKICEGMDSVIWKTTMETVSGHTLKHLFASLSVLFAELYVRDTTGMKRKSRSAEFVGRSSVSSFS